MPQIIRFLANFEAHVGPMSCAVDPTENDKVGQDKIEAGYKAKDRVPAQGLGAHAEPQTSSTTNITADVKVANNRGDVTGVKIDDVHGDVIISPPQPLSADQRRAMRNRQAMLELVKTYWVKGVLEKSLYSEMLIELGLEKRAGAVERPWDAVVQLPDQPNHPMPPGTSMLSVFDEMNKALLILGEPGSGKTTMLLELARDTIARAEQDLTQPIPVVFNLSSWTNAKQSIADWLEAELNSKYNIPRKIARPWIGEDDLLLLLDGLDEVKADQRDACVEAINAFRREHGLTQLVVCSRIKDYDALATRLRLQGAVLLQPLTSLQIDQYLKSAGVGMAAVRQTLPYDVALQELAQSPLALSIMTLAYRGMSVYDLQPLGSIEASRMHLFDAYVQQMFKRRGTKHRYSPSQTLGWLTWLAQKMTDQAQSIFLLERMRPNWLQTRIQQVQHVAIVAFVRGLLGGLVFALVFGLYGGLIPGLVGGLNGGLFFGLTFPRGYLDEPYEILRWSWEKAKKASFVRCMVGLSLGWLVA